MCRELLALDRHRQALGLGPQALGAAQVGARRLQLLDHFIVDAFLDGQGVARAHCLGGLAAGVGGLAHGATTGSQDQVHLLDQLLGLVQGGGHTFSWKRSSSRRCRRLIWACPSLPRPPVGTHAPAGACCSGAPRLGPALNTEVRVSPEPGMAAGDSRRGSRPSRPITQARRTALRAPRRSLTRLSGGQGKTGF